MQSPSHTAIHARPFRFPETLLHAPIFRIAQTEPAGQEHSGRPFVLKHLLTPRRLLPRGNGGTIGICPYEMIPLKKSIFHKKVCVIEQISRVTLAVQGVFLRNHEISLLSFPFGATALQPVPRPNFSQPSACNRVSHAISWNVSRASGTNIHIAGHFTCQG